MKKRLISLLLALALVWAPAARALEGDALRDARTLSSLGLVQGTSAGYDLEAGATRAQALVLLARLGGISGGGTLPYSDVPSWAAESVAALSLQGLLEDIFPPPLLYAGEYITADQWSALVLRLLGETVPGKGAALYALRLGLFSRDYGSPLTRGELFQMTREALTFSRQGTPALAERFGSGAEELLKQRLTPRQAADRHMAAVFCLTVYDSLSSYMGKDPDASASGFFITPDGVAITNYHAIQDALIATATLSTGEVFPVLGILWADEEADLAVLRVSRTRSDNLVTTPSFASLTLAGTAEVRPGDTVYALGNPLGLGLSVSSGIVSAVERETDISSLPALVTTADISSGSSGGALLNEFGHVVAVTSGAYIEGNGMYLAIPADSLLGADFSKAETVALKDLETLLA